MAALGVAVVIVSMLSQSTTIVVNDCACLHSPDDAVAIQLPTAVRLLFLRVRALAAADIGLELLLGSAKHV